MSLWTGLDRWKIQKASIDFSQITLGDMADGDLLTITEVGVPVPVLDALNRKPAGTTVSSNWGTTCVNLPTPNDHIVTFDHHTGIPCYLLRVPATATTKPKIQCYIGVYVPPRMGRPPTGAAWTAEDQT